MFDQLIIGDKASYDDFEANVSERTIKDGKKKEIKDSVPFSNVTHDFSAINGEVYWEEKELEYIFEIEADTAEELEEKKIAFKSWIMNVMNEELHDPFIKDYYFKATFSDIDVDDSEFEKATITVVFKAYPYMISNVKNFTTYKLTKTPIKVNIYNNSSHRITPTIKISTECIIAKGDTIHSFPAGEITDDSFTFKPGINSFTARTFLDEGTLTVEFREEVF